jgi:hypothetical protein
MKTVRNSIIIALFLLTVFACSNLTTSDDLDETVENPTLAGLVGTWKRTTTDVDGETTETIEKTLIVSPDGSFFDKFAITASSTSGTYISCDCRKGTLSVLGDELTEETTHTASNETGADPADGDWIARPSTSWGPAILVDGKLYFLVAKAEGSVSGIVGTWTIAIYDSLNDPDFYEKCEYQFQSDGSGTQTAYNSADGVTYSGDTPEELTYVSAGNGRYTVTKTTEEKTVTGYCRIVGSYLILGDTTSADANAYIKQ